MNVRQPDKEPRMLMTGVTQMALRALNRTRKPHAAQPQAAPAQFEGQSAPRTSKRRAGLSYRTFATPSRADE